MFLLILTILESFLTGLETRTLTADLSLQVTENASSAPMSYTGHATMLGERFVLSAFGAEAAYDGKTLYVYNEDLDELTLSNPSQDELLEANPLLFARALYKVCNVTERDNKSGTETIVTLTPRDQKAGILRFVLRIDKKTQLPQSIEVVESNRTTRIRLLNAKYDVPCPPFRIDAPKSAFINDLR